MNFIIKQLETDRLILELPKIDFAEDIYQYASEPDVTKYLTWDIHTSIKDSIDFIKWTMERNSTSENAIWIITEKESNKNIWSIGIHKSKSGNYEIWYWIGKPFWWKWYMTEALDKVKEFAQFSWFNELVGKHIIENEWSWKVFIKNWFKLTWKEEIKDKNWSMVTLNIFTFKFN